jgi:hypothetical protein
MTPFAHDPTPAFSPRSAVPPDIAPVPDHGEEMLVVDARGQVTPSQMVEDKLNALMRAVSRPSVRRD